MKRAALIVLALLALAACQPQGPDRKAAPKADAPPAAIDFSQPMTARGNEPFWALAINGTQVTLTRPGHPDVTAQTPAPVIQAGRATWIAAAPGQQITITVYESPCSDGMSDRSYPLTAEVVLLNETLRGCAGPPDQKKRGNS